MANGDGLHGNGLSERRQRRHTLVDGWQRDSARLGTPRFDVSSCHLVRRICRLL